MDTDDLGDTRMTRRLVALCVVTLALFAAGSLPVSGRDSAVTLATPAGAAPTVYTVGAGPLADVLAQADAAKKCGLSRDQLAAMVLAPTFPETGAGGGPIPASPMTMSRYDNQIGLYAFASTTRYPKAFFHPGVGLWQFDSAGGWPLIAAAAINTQTSAQQAATLMANRWCTNPTRTYSWAPWFGCTSTSICEDIYNSIFDGTTLSVVADPTVTSLGGAEQRECDIVMVGRVTCWYVDPARAQGLTSWTAQRFGPSPVTAPFYSYAIGTREYRTWLQQDTGYDATVNADKPITANARTSINWTTADGLCDATEQRGSCRPLLDGPLVSANADGRQQVFTVATDGTVWTNWQTVANGGWKGWTSLGGNLQGSLSIGVSTDDRMELFGLGSDGAIKHNWQVSPNGAWNGWVSRGGNWPKGAQPTATRNTDGRMEVFLIGPDGALWHMWQVVPNGDWSGWLSNGGNWPPTAELTIGRNADGRLESFVVGADRALWHQWQVPSAPTGWSSFQSLGGSLLAQPTVGYSADGRQELFAVGSSGTLMHLWQHAPNGNWSTWQSMGGAWTATADLVAVRNTDNRLEVFGQSADRSVVHSWQLTPNGVWSPFSSLGGYANRGPGLGRNADGRLQLFVVAGANEVRSMVQSWGTTSGWTDWLSLGTPGS